MKISERVREMELSPIRKFNRYAIEAEASGKKVYHLNIGQPDVETAECFMKAIKEYDKEVIAYAESGGNVELKDAIIEYFREYGMEYERGDIMITAGGSEALSMIFTAILDPGDEVIIAEPFYTNYRTFVKAACGKVVSVTTSAEDGYRYADMEKLEKAVTERTRAICCINPGNPTGNVLSREEMETIIAFAKKYDLFIIADEVYREFVYDGRETLSFGQFSDADENVIIVDSVSKRFSACGARIGCLVTKNKEVSEAAMKLAQGRLCVSTIDQIGAAKLYGLGQDYYEEVKGAYENRRDAVYEEIMKIQGAICEKPGGAFYLTVKLPIEDAEDFLMFMLTEFERDGETVMFAPASGFYDTEGLGRNEIRIAYVLKKEELKKATALLSEGLRKYMVKYSIDAASL